MTTPVIESGDITTSTGTGTGGSPTFPDYVSGDLLIMFIGLDDDATANALTAPASAPNGEPLILSSTGSGGHSGGGPTQGVVAWVGDATISSAGLAWTWTGSEFSTARCIKVLAGEFDPATPLGVTSDYSGNTSGSGTTTATPVWTPGASDGGGKIVVHICTDVEAITDAEPATGWTLVVNTDHGGVASAIATRDAAAVNSTEITSVNYTVAGGDSSSTKGVIVREISGPVTASADVAFALTIHISGPHVKGAKGAIPSVALAPTVFPTSSMLFGLNLN